MGDNTRPSPAATVGAAELPALFAQIFATAADAMLVIDSDGRIVLANAQCAHMFGYPIDTLYRMGVEDLVPERIRVAHQAHRKLYARRAVPRPMGINTSLRALRSDQSEFPVEISLSPLQSGKVKLFCANIRNVSELRRAQQSVERANRAEAVAEFGRLALGSSSTSEVVQSAALLVQAHLRCRAVLIARLHGQPLCAELEPGCPEPTESVKALLPTIVRRLTRGTVNPADPVIHIEDLDALEPDAHAAMQRAQIGGILACAIPGASEPIGLIAALGGEEDSFVREDGSFLGSLANTLGAVKQRQLAEEQLFQSQRLEALGQLTGGVAHDFNNLLTVVSGNLQILEERVASDSSTLAAVRAGLRAASRGADLTRKLLAFARRQTLQPRAIDIEVWMESLAEILRRTLGPNIEVITRIPQHLPAAKADPAMLDTAMLNLAVNARDAMPEGGSLTLEAQTISHPTIAREGPHGLPRGTYIMLSVSDTGAGMSPEVLARAFEPFFTTKGTAKGSGLGLSLVYGFVKQSGGHIEVESQPGTGTTVRMLLPTLEAPDQAQAPAPIDAAEGGNETILVLEDDEDVRNVAVAFLRGLGYSVTEAADGDEALRLLGQSESIDLLFTDVVLRGSLDGAAVARKALEADPRLGVLFTSGYAPQTLRLDQTLSRGVELLVKPYRIEQLARLIRRALDARNQAAASSRRESLRPTTPRKRSRS